MGSGPSSGTGGSGLVVVHEPAAPFVTIRGVWNLQGVYNAVKAGDWI